MDNDDNEHLIMYQDTDDNDEAITPSKTGEVPSKGIMSMPAMTASLRRMERELIENKKKIVKLENVIRALLSRSRRADHGHRTHSSQIDDLWHNLENKIDWRD